MQIEKVLMGAGAGITYGLTLYAKTEGEDFDFMKFGTTVAIGAGAGVINVLLNMPIAGAYEYMLNIGLVTIIENGFKAINRKIIQPFIMRWQCKNL